MHGLTCLRRLIAACLIALAVVLLKVLFGENVFPSAIPPETIAIIREYIATVDRFIADGDVHALEWHLATLGTNLALWPQPADGAFEPIAALAFRATFPCLHIGLAGIHIAGEFHAFATGMTGNVATLPTWLSESVPVYPAEREDIVHVANGQIELLGVTSSPTLLVSPVPDAETSIWLSAPARLVASRITLTPSDDGPRYLAVSTPGFIVPEREALSVEGNGQLLVLTPESNRWQRIPVGVTTVIAPADLLLIPFGNAILTMTGGSPAELVIVSMVSLESSAVASMMSEGGRSGFDLAALMLDATTSPTAAWFGSIASAGSTDRVVAGAIGLDATWLLMPPGQQGSIRSPKKSVAVEIGSEFSQIVSDEQQRELENTGETAGFLFVVRLHSR